MAGATIAGWFAQVGSLPEAFAVGSVAVPVCCMTLALIVKTADEELDRANLGISNSLRRKLGLHFFTTKGWNRTWGGAEIADWHRVHRVVGDRRYAKYGGGGHRRHSGYSLFVMAVAAK
jgi:hypothetical protein